MRKIAVSIVIPHYNMVNTCIRLIESIPDREDIEVIVADDHSDDNLDSLRECIGSRRCRESCLINSKVNMGAGAERNEGIKRAHGNWLMFADADDFFLDNMWDSIEPYLESDYDIVYFPPTSRDDQTNMPLKRHESYERLVRDYRNDPDLNHTVRLKYWWDSPWSKLIKREVFVNNEVFFDAIPCGNDVVGSIKAAYYADKIAASEDTIYCITNRHVSSDRTYDKRKIRMRVFLDKYAFLKERVSQEEFAFIDFDRQILGFIIRHFKQTNSFRETKELWDMVKKEHIRFKCSFIIQNILNTYFNLNL